VRARPPRQEEPAPVQGLRLDKWLWQARFFKSRALAAELAEKRRVRINCELVTKAHHRVRPGDVLTFPQGARIRVVRVLALGERRGPASEAQGLYEDLEGGSRPQPERELNGPLIVR
jgi:ribosome-associated heat shock protein Hsp15